jgi:hypothetical protein
MLSGEACFEVRSLRGRPVYRSGTIPKSGISLEDHALVSTPGYSFWRKKYRHSLPIAHGNACMRRSQGIIFGFFFVYKTRVLIGKRTSASF